MESLPSKLLSTVAPMRRSMGFLNRFLRVIFETSRLPKNGETDIKNAVLNNHGQVNFISLGIASGAPVYGTGGHLRGSQRENGFIEIKFRSVGDGEIYAFAKSKRHIICGYFLCIPGKIV